MAHPRSAFGAPPQGGAASGPAKPVPRRLLAAALATLAVSGCAVPEPWVKPYERERLADPIMKGSADPLSARHREHVLVVREAARGANSAQGGGCGCN